MSLRTVSVTMTQHRVVDIALQVGGAATLRVLDEGMTVLLAQQKVLVGPPGRPGETRTHTLVTASTIQPDVDQYDAVAVEALDQALYIANPAGVPSDTQRVLLRIRDNGAPQQLTYGSQYRPTSAVPALPAATVPGKTMYFGFVYNKADAKYDLIAFNA